MKRMHPSSDNDDDQDDEEYNFDSETLKKKANVDVSVSSTAGPTPSDDKDILFATDTVEGIVLRAAARVTSELKASYEKDVFADLIMHECLRGIHELNAGIRLERSSVVALKAFGRTFGCMKVPFIFYTQRDCPLLIFEVKTKRSALKDIDIEGLACIAEQIGLEKKRMRPRALVLNFAAGEYTSIVLQKDGTINQ